jgi:GNAT superfamily N-acetyltransferase
MKMTIDAPRVSFSPSLRGVWEEAFGNQDGFLDQFERYGYDPSKMRCVTVDGEIVSLHYIFDCEYASGRVAYIYGVATKNEHRGKGYSTALLEDTHRYLVGEGYAGALLVPASASLFGFYERLGYKKCASVTELTVSSSGSPVPIYQINAAEYMTKRRELLPDGAVLQDKGKMLDYIASDNEFFYGDGFILAAREYTTDLGERALFGTELLGSADHCPEILTSLGYSKGTFRTVGEDRPFAAYLSFNGAPAPTWFAFEM